MSLLKTVLCTFALSGCMLFAQGGDEAARLVRLNVTATAADLTADDFRVTDDGKVQRIALFRGPQSAAANAHELSNRPVPAPHTTAVLFDLMNEGRADRLDASKKIGQSLKQLDSGESVYFYLLLIDGKLLPVHAIEPGAPPNKTWTQDVDATLAKAMKNQNGNRPAGINDEDVVKRTYVALETIANQLSAFPGRHDILWVTNGIPNVWGPKTCSGDWIDCALYVPHLSVTLEHAGVVANPISYSSLSSPDSGRTMEEFAGLTGGRAYFNEDMRTLINQLAASASYFIAYEPPHDNWDSKFHKVKVTCERKGVKVDAKQRYYALPDSRPGPQRQQATLVAAYQSTSDVSEIGLRVAVSSPTPNTAHLEIHVDPADLLLHESGSQYNGQLTVLLSARAASGPQGEPTLSPMALHLTREQLKSEIPIVRDYAIDAATQKVRIIVLDQGANSVGSLTVPVSH